MSKGAKIIARLKRFADALEQSDSITDKFTCRTVRLNLEPQPHSPELVKETREVLGTSQAVFAQFLGVSVKTVHDWEQGRKPPKEIACRLMSEIRRDPKYWQARLRELAVTTEEARDSVGHSLTT